jgi:hypothetical protein
MSITIDLDFRARLHPVRDQGIRHTCLAHAASLAHEHQRHSTLALSVEYLHYFASQRNPDGSSIGGTATALAVNGQPKEDDCPYQSVEPSTTWTPQSGIDVFRRNSTSPAPHFLSVQADLHSGHVPVLGIAMPSGFHIASSPWILTSDGSNIGLHAVAAVGLGHTASQRLILIRNSWGSTWADAGHAWIDSTFFENQVQAVLLLTTEVVH